LRFRQGVFAALLLALLALAYMERSLYLAIREQAGRDEATRADALVTFGAAEYNGVPSPVLKARLDHAFDLEERGLAPLIITSGGSGGDPQYTEAGVGRDYLIQRGVAEDKILADTGSLTTYETVKTVTLLLTHRQKHTCIAVSDGFHLYRIKLMFRSLGVTAYASPAPNSPIEADSYLRTLHSLREMVVTSIWYVGFRK
jgi:uncharacterized SAM-binding protein YcdF (DUF218 family)